MTTEDLAWVQSRLRNCTNARRQLRICAECLSVAEDTLLERLGYTSLDTFRAAHPQNKRSLGPSAERICNPVPPEVMLESVLYYYGGARISSVCRLMGYTQTVTPEAMGSINALCAADWVIIPVDCDKWACDGMQEIVEQIEQVQAYYNPRLKIMGALMTKYRRTRYAEDIIVQLCASGISVLETVIRYTVKVSEAAHAGMPLLEYCPDCTAAVDYRELTEEVERIVSNVDTKEG